jgi:type III pantothenate kinase
MEVEVTLCLDFGNTRLKYAVFNNALQHVADTLPNDEVSTLEKLLNTYQPHKTILSSVISHNAAIEQLLATRSVFTLLTHNTLLPFTTPVAKPQTIGTDRLALCAAAVQQFEGNHNLAIALGTCITYNFINKYKEFIGGGISPGMDMRFKSLELFTAKLPLIQEDWNFPLIGYNTRTNILSGVILGMAKEIDGIIDAYKEKYNNFNVLLTGGNCTYFVPHLKNQIFADADLLFKGLYAISAYNTRTETTA